MKKCKTVSKKACTCPYCGGSIICKETAFCEPCGKKFVNCKKCGKMIPDNLTICPSCKEKI
ncbi:MAG: hypothetical protein PHX78_11100 [bacterium]|nr:hypothetical protein [bacterium]